MQGGKKPTKEQQNWQDWQRDQGCCNCGASNPAIHHCAGSTAKHNKIHIGQWWTIPLCYECHQGDEGIHGNLKRLYDFDMPREFNRKDAEKRKFKDCVFDYFHFDYGELPMPLEVIEAIRDYHK